MLKKDENKCLKGDFTEEVDKLVEVAKAKPENRSTKAIPNINAFFLSMLSPLI